jgi:hypothetical protein
MIKYKINDKYVIIFTDNKGLELWSPNNKFIEDLSDNTLISAMFLKICELNNEIIDLKNKNKVVPFPKRR